MNTIISNDIQQPLSLMVLEKLLWTERIRQGTKNDIMLQQSELYQRHKSSSPKEIHSGKRKRASKTCTECHRRKIRCNIEDGGGPCNKCQSNETKCIPFVGGRKRALQQRVKLAIERAVFGGVPETSNCWSALLQSSHEAVASSPSSQASSCAFLEQGTQSDTTDTTDVSFDCDIGSSPDVNPDSLSLFPFESQMAPSMTFADIFEPFPAHLTLIDVEYLKSRQALTIPSRLFQKHLLSTYARFVHRNLPILDLQQLFTSFDYESSTNQTRGHERGTKVPLLLFQAVMFVAVAYVDINVLKSAGYQDRHDAQRRFYKGVRTLYDLNTCSDRLSTIQAVLLIALGSFACNFESLNVRDSWYWMGIATSSSYSLGLNHNEPLRKIPLRDRKLRRRIWWSVVILDRLLQLCPLSEDTARAHRISFQDCNVEMLKLDDFDLQPPYYDGHDEFDETQMGEDALNFIDMAMICRYGYDLALYRYPSELQANRDLKLATFLRDIAVEENNSTRVASYTFPISNEVEGIVLLSAVI